MWAGDIAMLAVGWASGVATALLYHRALDKPEPLDPALLPEYTPMPKARNLELVPRPDLSEFAPKPKRVWRAPKQQRQTSWTAEPPPPPKPPAQPPAPPPPASRGLLPPVSWGQKHTAAPSG